MSSADVKPAFQGGDVSGQPSLEALPSLDIDVASLTPEMRMARMLSAESLNLAPPKRPDDTTTAVMSAWSDQELKSWMRSKHQRAEAARKELDRAAVQNHRQRILAGALVGLVYEDVARTLLSLPVPGDLSSEPEIAAMYVDLMRAQAAPYLVHSRQAYVACAGNAEPVEALHHWTNFCHARLGQLPALADDSDVAPVNETVVTVVQR